MDAFLQQQFLDGASPSLEVLEHILNRFKGILTPGMVTDITEGITID